MSVNLEELLPLLGRGAAMGAVPGAIGGALGDKDDRLGGALKGGLAGGALGAAMHGAPSLMSEKLPRPDFVPGGGRGGVEGKPSYQGFVGDKQIPHGVSYAPRGQNISDRLGRSEQLVPIDHPDPSNYSERWVPSDVEPTAYDLLRYSPLDDKMPKRAKSAMVNYLSPNITAALKTAGLHRLTGEMYGVGEMTAAKAAGLLGAASYFRRKQAALVKGGLESLAVLDKSR